MKALIVIAIIANVIACCVVAYIWIDEPPVNCTAGEWLFIVLPVTVYPILNLITVCLLTLPKDSWLGLYFKRKRLEERKRIQELEGKPPAG